MELYKIFCGHPISIGNMERLSNTYLVEIPIGKFSLTQNTWSQSSIEKMFTPKAYIPPGLEGKQGLRSSSAPSRACRHFAKGACAYGPACQLSHDPSTECEFGAACGQHHPPCPFRHPPAMKKARLSRLANSLSPKGSDKTKSSSLSSQPND